MCCVASSPSTGLLLSSSSCTGLGPQPPLFTPPPSLLCLPLPQNPPSPTHRRHPLSVKADCFHASRVLQASTLSHYIRQRGDGERGSMIGSVCVAVFQKLQPQPRLQFPNFVFFSLSCQGRPNTATTQILT